MKTNKMQELYELTKKFNSISASINEVSQKSFSEQYDYIKEEFKEMTETFDNVDYNEGLNLTNLLDDCLDVVITVFGMMQKLETLGVNVQDAAVATAMNNLSKYPVKLYDAYETVDRKSRDGITVVSKFNEEYNCYTLRNKETGKVVKPWNFVSNDLSKFVPEGLEIE